MRMDTSDFKAIVKEFHPIFFKISKSYTRDAADFDDLYQEVLIQVWRSLKNFRGDSRSSTWVYRVALNTAMTFHRDRKRKYRLFSGEEIERLPERIEHQDTSDQEEKLALMYRSIQQLPQADRALILLQLEGKSFQEIAEILGISVSNVGVKLMRSRKKIQTYIQKSGYERV